MVRSAARLGDLDGVGFWQIKSDLTYFNERLLNYEFGFSSWYEQVAHGLLLLSVCAPITMARGIGKLLIGSSNPRDQLEPWGSHPDIDNRVSWAGVVAVHDGLELSRQQKMRYMCAAAPQYLTHLRVCHFSPANCSRCEKCFRTIVGLSMEGVNPGDCGFKVDERTLARARQAILTGKMPSWSSEMIEWTDLQRSLPDGVKPDIFGSREFFAWFERYDFSRHRVSRRRVRLWIIRLRLLRLYQGIRHSRATRRRAAFLAYLAICNWHVALARGRRVATGRPPSRQAPPPATGKNEGDRS